jgi:hypothetical protein
MGERKDFLAKTGGAFFGILVRVLNVAFGKSPRKKIKRWIY